MAKADHAAGTVVRFLIDENNLTGYSQAFLEVEDSGLAKTKRYDFADDLITQVDDPDSAIESAHHFLYDGLGSTRSLTNELGDVAAAYNYTPFGSPLGFGLNADQPHLFAGEWFDASLGYSYNRARYYDTTTGRFTGFDPVEDMGNRNHRFAYSGSDSINHLDPSGKFFLVDIGIAGLGIGELAVMTQGSAQTVGPLVARAAGVDVSNLFGTLYGDWGPAVDRITSLMWAITKNVGLETASYVPILGAIIDAKDLIDLTKTAYSIVTNPGAYSTFAKVLVFGLIIVFLVSVLFRPLRHVVKPLMRFDAARRTSSVVKVSAKGSGRSNDVVHMQLRHRVDLDEIPVHPWNRARKTNRQRMEEGQPPITRDGVGIVMHHNAQDPRGPIIEMPQSTHTKYDEQLHLLDDTLFGVDGLPTRQEWNADRKDYWEWVVGNWENHP